MIPADLASRLKLLLDTPLPQVGATPATARAPLGDLPPGTRFTAQVLTPLPEGTFRALVAGKTVTLSLPQSVKSGDVLELVTRHTAGQTVFAALAEPPSSATPTPRLSPAGQLISQLMTGRLGEPSPAPLNQGAPILAQPPQHGAQLAPALAKALKDSGLFYEAHQAEWVAGRLPLERLLSEPQGRLSSLLQPRQAPAQDPSPPSPGQVPERGTEAAATRATPPGQADAPDTGAEPSARAASTPAAAKADASPPLSGSLPREVAPLVHQQLDSLVSQQLAWQGQVWPGQQMDWVIELPERAAQTASDEDDGHWRTTLKLILPSLGEVEAELHLTPAGLAARFIATDAASVGRLDAGLPELAAQLEAHGLPLTGAVVVQRD